MFDEKIVPTTEADLRSSIAYLLLDKEIKLTLMFHFIV